MECKSHSCGNGIQDEDTVHAEMLVKEDGDEGDYKEDEGKKEHRDRSLYGITSRLSILPPLEYHPPLQPPKYHPMLWR